MRIIARSPTPFQLKNPALKEALKALGIEWLTPDQVKRICQCPAPSRTKARRGIDREFSSYRFLGVDPYSPKRSPKCNRFFWAWRRDQTTCDIHRWAASLLRAEKHRERKSDRLRNRRQLKEARQQRKRINREKKRAQRLAQKSQPRPLTDAQLQARKIEADFRLLQSVWFEMLETDDFKRLGELIRDGFVLPPDAESETYRLSTRGHKLYMDLKRRTGRRPATI